MANLTFQELREANIKRAKVFKNRKGQVVHPGGIMDWTLSQWSNALAGELGESANLIKKIERGDFTLLEIQEELAKELADVQCYLSILAIRAGIDLCEATRSKFNEVSDRVGCDIKL